MATMGDNQHLLEDYFDQLLLPTEPEQIDLATPVFLLSDDDREQANGLQNLAKKLDAKVYFAPHNIVLSQEVIQEYSMGADSCMDIVKQLWNTATLDCLVIDVQGLNLALPVTAVGLIKALDANDIMANASMSHGQMAKLPLLGQSFNAVDTADIVMPGKVNPTTKSQYRYLVALRYVPWAIAVSSVVGAVSFAKEDIHWRSSQTQRPWLAGTVASKMTAILDPFALVGCLKDDK